MIVLQVRPKDWLSYQQNGKQNDDQLNQAHFKSCSRIKVQSFFACHACMHTMLWPRIVTRATGLVLPVTCRLSKQLHFETRECCCRSRYLLELQKGLRFKNRQLLPIVSFIDSVKAAVLVFQNNETAAMLVYQVNPVGIDLLVCMFCFLNTGHVIILSGNRFFQISSDSYLCISMHNLWKDNGPSSPGTGYWENTTYKKRFIELLSYVKTFYVRVN